MRIDDSQSQLRTSLYRTVLLIIRTAIETQSLFRALVWFNGAPTRRIVEVARACVKESTSKTPCARCANSRPPVISLFFSFICILVGGCRGWYGCSRCCANLMGFQCGCVDCWMVTIQWCNIIAVVGLRALFRCDCIMCSYIETRVKFGLKLSFRTLVLLNRAFSRSFHSAIRNRAHCFPPTSSLIMRITSAHVFVFALF